MLYADLIKTGTMILDVDCYADRNLPKCNIQYWIVKNDKGEGNIYTRITYGNNSTFHGINSPEIYATVPNANNFIVKLSSVKSKNDKITILKYAHYVSESDIKYMTNLDREN